MLISSINQPKIKSKWRRLLGKEYFICKRKITWLLSTKNSATIQASNQCIHPVFKHQSLLLRPLKNVDMYLQYNKIINLNTAIKHVNGVVIKPGQVFSFWQLVGRPTAKKGYKVGLALQNGIATTSVGGGLCQLGNLLYWMALHSPLDITERWRHGFDVFPDVNRLIPFGCGATLAFNYIDLQFTNNTNYTFQLHLYVDEQYVYGNILSNKIINKSYAVVETDHTISMQWWGGYTRHNKISRHITCLDTGQTQQQFITENNAIMMYNPLIENKK